MCFVAYLFKCKSAMFTSEDLIHDIFACMIDITWCWSVFILLCVVVCDCCVIVVVYSSITLSLL